MVSPGNGGVAGSTVGRDTLAEGIVLSCELAGRGLLERKLRFSGHAILPRTSTPRSLTKLAGRK
jgi:hypothetical protein